MNIEFENGSKIEGVKSSDNIRGIRSNNILFNKECWNPIFNLVMKIKYDFLHMYGEFYTNDFETWLTQLNKEEYNSVFECLQLEQFGDLLLIRYGLAALQPGMWEDPNSVYRECRSVVIDITHDQLVLTPFRKFFNLNEVQENRIETVTEKLKTANLVEITDKLDGSMQNARWYQDKVVMAGSKALNVADSWRLNDGYNMLTDKYIRMLKENYCHTFTFEMISLKDAHVVQYDKSQEGLYLIGIRNVMSGEQYPYSKVTEVAEKYGVRTVQMETKTFDDLLEGMKNHKSNEKEGWVLNIDGHLIKLKCDDYTHVHRILDDASSPNVVIQAIANETYDDLISKIPDRFRSRINQLAELIFDYIKETETKINQYYIDAPKEDRKTFMVWVDSNVPKELIMYIKNKYLNKKINVLIKRDLSKDTQYRKIKEMGIELDYSASFGEWENE